MKLIKSFYHWFMWRTFESDKPDKHQCDFKHSVNPGGRWTNAKEFEGYFCEKHRNHFGGHK